MKLKPVSVFSVPDEGFFHLPAGKSPSALLADKGQLRFHGLSLSDGGPQSG